MSEATTAELMIQYVMPNYGRFPIEFVKGEGSYGTGVSQLRGGIHAANFFHQAAQTLRLLR